MKLLLEFGPLLLFFVANAKFGIVPATSAFLISLLITLPISWKLAGKLPLMSVITAVFVGVFGGLTILLDDELFIQLKPTVASLFFAAAIGVGLARGKLLLKTVLGEAMPLDDEGWRILSIRWVGFFLVLAAVNEFVRATFTVDQWVTFKTFGILPMTFVFTLSQLGLMQRHELKEEAPAEEAATEPTD